MTKTQTEPTTIEASSSVHPILETYKAWVDTLVGYMQRAAELLNRLYAEQDQVIVQLRDLCAQQHSLRHADFDAIFARVLADRRTTTDSLGALVNAYRAGREAVIREIQEACASDLSHAVQAWPAIKERLLSQQDDGMAQIVGSLRQVHVEQEKVTAALTALVGRGERLKIEDVKAVAQKLATRDSRDSVELAALLAICESAGRDATHRWRRLAG